MTSRTLARDDGAPVTIRSQNTLTASAAPDAPDVSDPSLAAARLPARRSEAVACQATLAILLIGVIMSRSAQNERRRLHRLYLCRSQLLPDPRGATPWQVLWSSQDDRAFITTMGFDVKTFRILLEGPGHFADQWDSTPICYELVNLNLSCSGNSSHDYKS
ncbi:hypothetical protein F5887DRAFT_1076960 [Amanita rubescens]|nr:hypothetical protein F5887DRAFT_1076960 [Amanita rubescens]